MPSIRPYQRSDQAAVYDICVRTGHAGADARPVYRDPVIFPEIFAGPYLALDPGLCFVLADDTDTPVGYVLGTADTATFVHRFEQLWLPTVADRYPAPAGEPSTRDELMALLLHTPRRMLRPELERYPAHLHIDLLPGYQRAGHGRALIETLVAALRARGVRGLHLGMSPENQAALRFYPRVGFHLIEVSGDDPVLYLGRLLDGSPLLDDHH